MAMTPEELNEWLMETDVSDEFTEVAMKASYIYQTSDSGGPHHYDDESTLASLNESWSKEGFGRERIENNSTNRSFCSDLSHFESSQRNFFRYRDTSINHYSIHSGMRDDINPNQPQQRHQQFNSSCPSFIDDCSDSCPDDSCHQQNSFNSSCPSFLHDHSNRYPDFVPYPNHSRKETLPSGYYYTMEKSQKSQEYFDNFNKNFSCNEWQRKIMQKSRKSREMLMRSMATRGVQSDTTVENHESTPSMKNFSDDTLTQSKQMKHEEARLLIRSK